MKLSWQLLAHVDTNPVMFERATGGYCAVEILWVVSAIRRGIRFVIRRVICDASRPSVCRVFHLCR